MSLVLLFILLLFSKNLINDILSSALININLISFYAYAFAIKNEILKCKTIYHYIYHIGFLSVDCKLSFDYWQPGSAYIE